MSYAKRLIQRLASHPDPHAALDRVLAEMSPFELTVLAHDWEGFWCRDKQRLPDDSWQSFGFLTGRGFGKSKALLSYVLQEIMEGRARRVAFVGATMDSVFEIMLHGEAGILNIAPPWFPASLVKGHVEFPNNAIITPFSAEVPGSLRGPEHDLLVADELIAWSAATASEAFSNARLGLRLGYGKLLWSTTPKRRNPIIKYLLDRAERYPNRHRVVRGSSMENIDNLTKGTIEEMVQELGGTQRGREELMGEFFDESAGSLWKDAYISNHRRALPSTLQRHILAIDPAVTSRKGSDSTGMVRLAAADGQVFVCEDRTSRMDWSEWGSLAIQLYSQYRMDCIVAETNRGGSGIAANLRACGEKYGKTVQVVPADAVTYHSPNTILIKEVFARSAKESRAEPVATLYERGRVSHVIGADLADLEATLTTWEPGSGPSPDGMDALVWGVSELSGIVSARKNTNAFAGVEKANRMLRGGYAPNASMESILRSSGGGRSL